MSRTNRWPTMKLGDICDIIYGKALKKSDRVAGPVPVYGSNGVVDYHSEALFEGPTIVVGRKGSAGAVEWSDSSCWIIDTAFSVRPLSDDVDLRWLYWALKYLDLGKLQKHAAVPGISKSDVLREDILLPPLAEQQHIAEILDVTQRQFDLLKAKKTHLASLRTELVDQILEADDRETVLLKEIAEIQSGITKGRKARKGEILTETAYMAVSNVKDGHLDLETVKTIPATEAEITRSRLKTGDVLLTEGGDPDKLGRGTVWRDEIEPCLHQNHIFRVRLPEDSRFTPEVLMAMLSTKQARAYFFRSAKQTTGIASINKTQLSAVPVPILTDSEIAKLSEALTQIDILSSYIEKRRIATESLHRALSTRAFTGQL